LLETKILQPGENMIAGGLATVFVSDMDRAVRFYTETLALKLEYRFGNHWLR
jgi:predicted enzyme related to lactoylglutathione lyase